MGKRLYNEAKKQGNARYIAEKTDKIQAALPRGYADKLTALNVPVPYKATKSSSRGESARLGAVSLSAVSAMPRYTGGGLKRKRLI